MRGNCPDGPIQVGCNGRVLCWPAEHAEAAGLSQIRSVGIFLFRQDAPVASGLV